MVLPALVVVKVFLEGFASLGVGGLVGDVWVFFVAGAFIVFGAVGFPVAQAHPAEVVFAVVALHVVAAAVLLDTDVAFGAVFGVGADVVGCFAVVGTFLQPPWKGTFVNMNNRTIALLKMCKSILLVYIINDFRSFFFQ